MGDNRDKDKEASKNLNSEAESDILKKIDLAFQVNYVVSFGRKRSLHFQIINLNSYGWCNYIVGWLVGLGSDRGLEETTMKQFLWLP